MGRMRPVDHRITRMVYGVLIARSQDTRRRTIRDFMGNHNPLGRVMIAEMGKLDNREDKSKRSNQKIVPMKKPQIPKGLMLED